MFNNPKSTPGLISTERSHCKSGFAKFNGLNPVEIEPLATPEEGPSNDK